MAQESEARHLVRPLCGIDEEVDGQTVILRGRATGEVALSGRYRLHVRKTGPSGSSDVSQGGEFAIRPGSSVRIGQVGLSIESGGRYEAALTLVIGGETLECRASGPRSSSL